MSEKPHNDDSDTGADWITPEWIWQPLADALFSFDLDPAAMPHDQRGGPMIAVENWCGPPSGTNGLYQDWFGHVWLNHPYGRPQNPDWAEQVARQCGNPQVKTITALIPHSTGTDWYGDGFAHAKYKLEFHDRISFDTPDDSEDSDDNGASFASVLHCFEVTEPFPPEYIAALAELGDGNPEGPTETTLWQNGDIIADAIAEIANVDT